MIENYDLGASNVSQKVSKAAKNGTALSAERRKRLAGVATHPYTSDMNYKPDELEFLHAIEAYKAKTGRKFPTWTEVLSLVKEIGYVKPE